MYTLLNKHHLRLPLADKAMPIW